jgi:hypothetical protein
MRGGRDGGRHARRQVQPITAWGPSRNARSASVAYSDLVGAGIDHRCHRVVYCRGQVDGVWCCRTAPNHIHGWTGYGAFGSEQRAVVRVGEARRRWLESSEARLERRTSRTAFRDLSLAASRRLVARDYGSVLHGASVNPAAVIASSGKILGYLSDKRALVRTARGVEMKQSTIPLYVVGAGAVRRPVNLALVATGRSFAPAVPLRRVSIARETAGGVAFGLVDCV